VPRRTSLESLDFAQKKNLAEGFSLGPIRNCSLDLRRAALRGDKKSAGAACEYVGSRAVSGISNGGGFYESRTTAISR